MGEIKEEDFIESNLKCLFCGTVLDPKEAIQERELICTCGNLKIYPTGTKDKPYRAVVLNPNMLSFVKKGDFEIGENVNCKLSCGLQCNREGKIVKFFVKEPKAVIRWLNKNRSCAVPLKKLIKMEINEKGIQST